MSRFPRRRPDILEYSQGAPRSPASRGTFSSGDSRKRCPCGSPSRGARGTDRLSWHLHPWRRSQVRPSESTVGPGGSKRRTWGGVRLPLGRRTPACPCCRWGTDGAARWQGSCALPRPLRCGWSPVRWTRGARPARGRAVPGHDSDRPSPSGAWAVGSHCVTRVPGAARKSCRWCLHSSPLPWGPPPTGSGALGATGSRLRAARPP